MIAVKLDPEHVETQYLHRLAQPAGAHVIEIGCGDGRLTWRYAAVAACVCGTDPDIDRLARAIQARPASLAHRVHFVQAPAEGLPFAGQSFDLAIFAWSL